MKKHLLWILPLVILLITGCAKNQAIPDVITPVTLPDNGESVIAAQNQFAFNFFKAALTQDPSDANKLISPLSIYLDLSMVYNGASTSTLDGMRTALQLQDVGSDLLNQTNRSLITQLPKTDPAVSLNIANSIWYRNAGVQPLNDFLHITDDDYLAKVAAANFGDPSTVGQINDWVSVQTKGKIKSIVDKIDPEDVMFLINAVYFKGQWTFKFDKGKTRNRNFNAAGGSKVQAPFMTQEATLRYFQNDSMQCVELPYGGGAFNMYVLLPAENLTTSQLASSLNETVFTRDISSLDSLRMELWMPKWTYSYAIKDMKPELTALGMGKAFSSGADFSKMYPAGANVYISKAVHKTYIAVDEQGTEAAAATSVGMGITSIPVGPPKIILDRPFLYVIAEKATGTILFIGEMNNPLE